MATKKSKAAAKTANAKKAKKASPKKRALAKPARSAKAPRPGKSAKSAKKLTSKPLKKKASKRAAPARATKGGSAQTVDDTGLRALIERAAPEIIVRLGEADAPIGELAALVLVDNDDELRVRVDSAAAVANFVATQMPDARELRASLARRLDGAIHCLIVVERGADEADVTYVALEIEARTAN